MRFEYTSCSSNHSAVASAPVSIELEGYSAEDYIYRIVRESRGFYEQDLLDHLAQHGPYGGTYLDVGANIGNHAVFFGKFLANDLICIEPFSPVRSVLRRNLIRNGLSKAIVVGFGAGDKEEVRHAVIPEGGADNIGRVQLHESVTSSPAEGRSHRGVHVRRLDDILQKIAKRRAVEPIALVKIDVEGMQQSVIHGLTHTIEQSHPDIVVEAPSLEEYNVVARMLEPRGYRLLGQFCRTPTYHFSARTIHYL